METVFKLEKVYAAEMVAHARLEAPDECCGILAGVHGRVCKLFRTTNTEHSPIRYSIDPTELFNIYEELDKNGWELLGIYHSHTHTDAYPSPVDIEFAYFPDSLYFIISLSNVKQEVIRGFRIVKGIVSETELVII